MRRLVPRHTTRRPARPVTRIPTVCVVDPNADDYQGWQATAETCGVRLQIVASAEEALRVARTSTVDMWVINTELPGLSGVELCGMIKSRSRHSAVYLVADEYSIEAEQAAWRARASVFTSKPAHRIWLDQWLHARSLKSESRDHANV